MDKPEKSTFLLVKILGWLSHQKKKVRDFKMSSGKVGMREKGTRACGETWVFLGKAKGILVGGRRHWGYTEGGISQVYYSNICALPQSGRL